MPELQTDEDVVIAGAGPIGLACAISARRRGLRPLVIDGGAIVHSIARCPIGMTFFTSPERLEIGSHPLACAGQKPTREEALMYYRGVVRTEDLRVRTYTRLISARADGGGGAEGRGAIEGGGATSRGPGPRPCPRPIIAPGYFDPPNLLG